MQMNSNSIKKVKSILQTFRCTLHKLFRTVLSLCRSLANKLNGNHGKLGKPGCSGGIFRVVIKGLIENGDDIVAG